MDFKYNASINTSQVSFSAVYLIVTSDINSGIAISNKSHVLVIGIKISATTIFNAVISLGEGSLSARPLQKSVQIISVYKIKLLDKSPDISNLVNLAN